MKRLGLNFLLCLLWLPAALMVLYFGVGFGSRLTLFSDNEWQFMMSAFVMFLVPYMGLRFLFKFFNRTLFLLNEENGLKNRRAWAYALSMPTLACLFTLAVLVNDY